MFTAKPKFPIKKPAGIILTVLGVAILIFFSVLAITKEQPRVASYPNADSATNPSLISAPNSQLPKTSEEKYFQTTTSEDFNLEKPAYLHPLILDKYLPSGTIITINITLHANGGSFSNGQETATVNTPLNAFFSAQLPTAPTKNQTDTGQAASLFAGWSLTPDGSQPFDFSTAYIDRPIELYAIWAE